VIAIFTNQAALDNIKPHLPSGIIIGIPLQSADGRVEICNDFTDADRQEIIANGGQIVDVMPDNWQYPLNTL